MGLMTVRLGGVGVREPRDPNRKVHLEAEKVKADSPPRGNGRGRIICKCPVWVLLWLRLAPLA